jgi:hypothetical protein
MEQNQQGAGQGRGRRGHFHRGRRGPDRRGPGGPESRTPPPADAQPLRGEHPDVEQIMRDIRARIAQRHGIDLSTQQVSELAARRLEAILEPRNLNPTLMEQLRKAAGSRPVKDVVTASVPSYTFEDSTIYETHRGLLRLLRRLFNPILRLFFNPNPIVHALHIQARVNAEQEARLSEWELRQAEWNALHYELVRRMVSETAKLSIELQALTLRVESLGTRVDFADKRVRTLEAAPQPRHGARAPVPEPNAHSSSVQVVSVAESAPSGNPAVATATDSTPGVEGQRKRRRRRRGRRTGGPFGDTASAQSGQPGANDNGAEEFGDASDDGLEGDNDGPEEMVAGPEGSPVEPSPSALSPSAPSPALAAPEVADAPDPQRLLPSGSSGSSESGS